MVAAQKEILHSVHFLFVLGRTEYFFKGDFARTLGQLNFRLNFSFI